MTQHYLCGARDGESDGRSVGRGDCRNIRRFSDMMNYINKLKDDVYVENFDVPWLRQRISEGYLKAECQETRR